MLMLVRHDKRNTDVLQEPLTALCVKTGVIDLSEFLNKYYTKKSETFGFGLFVYSIKKFIAIERCREAVAPQNLVSNQCYIV